MADVLFWACPKRKPKRRDDHRLGDKNIDTPEGSRHARHENALRPPGCGTGLETAARCRAGQIRGAAGAAASGCSADASATVRRAEAGPPTALRPAGGGGKGVPFLTATEILSTDSAEDGFDNWTHQKQTVITDTKSPKIYTRYRSAAVRQILIRGTQDTSDPPGPETHYPQHYQQVGQVHRIRERRPRRAVPGIIFN
ncbi:hypothetical protein SKAU_G00375250 [Synaphobranchus kaupii]|uniref:Uncharacterized protein n=1 Tax=Synaphobranchus kaupii TaxID=118154 RepID=A0A9Q1EGY3_SYNKA|nr:hypothetical protein SKAU_G00375250 [Synaphobranchus kaupii]